MISTIRLFFVTIARFLQISQIIYSPANTQSHTLTSSAHKSEAEKTDVRRHNKNRSNRPTTAWLHENPICAFMFCACAQTVRSLSISIDCIRKFNTDYIFESKNIWAEEKGKKSKSNESKWKSTKGDTLFRDLLNHLNTIWSLYVYHRMEIVHTTPIRILRRKIEAQNFSIRIVLFDVWTFAKYPQSSLITSFLQQIGRHACIITDYYWLWLVIECIVAVSIQTQNSW